MILYRRIVIILGFIVLSSSMTVSAKCYSDAECALNQICNDKYQCVADGKFDRAIDKFTQKNEGLFSKVVLVDLQPSILNDSTLNLKTIDKVQFYCGLKWIRSDGNFRIMQAQYFTRVWVNMFSMNGKLTSQMLIHLNKGDLLTFDVSYQGYVCAN